MREPGKGLGFKNTLVVSAFAHIGIALTRVVVDSAHMVALPSHDASDSPSIADVATNSDVVATSASDNYVVAAT